MKKKNVALLMAAALLISQNAVYVNAEASGVNAAAQQTETESEEQTALRELREETGLTAGLLPGFRAVTDYSIAGIYKKTVVLFMAKSDGTPSADPREISEYRWVTAEAAKELMYPQYAGIINAAESFGCALCV